MTHQGTFVYVVYIATTAEKAWQALTEGEVTRQYWGYQNLSDWKAGSTWEHRHGDSRKLALAGRVIEVDPPRRLVLTWAEPNASESKQSRVTFALEPVEGMVRLTVIHDQLETGSEMDRSIREGWPRVLSSLKSFLETGRPLDTWAKSG